MQTIETPPEELSERQLFNEYMEINGESLESFDAYEEATLEERRSALLAEVGERLETLEAIKSLIDTTK